MIDASLNVFIVLVSIFVFCCNVLTVASLRIEYPEVRRNESIVDNYFGIKVHDPYRWLEDLDSAETSQFVERQLNLTESFLEKIPARESIRKSLLELWNFSSSDAPEKAGKRYFWLENTGLQDQSTMYVQESLNGPKTIFLDPAALSKDGLSLDTYAFSRDGEVFAYALSIGGSDPKVVRFRNVRSREDLPDVLLHTKWPAMSWSADGLGIFYMRYPAQESAAKTAITQNGQIYYHKLGTPQQDDILVMHFPGFPKRYLVPLVSDDQDGRYIMVRAEDVNNASMLFVGDLRRGIDATLKGRMKAVFSNPLDANYFYITSKGSRFIFQTNKDASNWKLISVDVQHNPENNPGATSTFLEEDKWRVLDWALPFDHDKIIVCYEKDVRHQLEIRSLHDASLLEIIPLPVGKISTFHVENKESKEFFFKLTSFVIPGLIYHCKSENGFFKCEIIRRIEVKAVDFSQIVMEQLFYRSKDGTRVPMYVVRHKTVPLDGSAPAVLYGYGGYGISIMPDYSNEAVMFALRFRGIYVSANIRGGNEYGERWHAEGSLLNKQNVFDDIQAAAEFLIQRKYTVAKKLTIKGLSNGGLLVGACVNQRPDLFGAAIAQVGVMDMLRFQLFTIGYVWCSEFGCSDDKRSFENLIKYSPLHNIRVPNRDRVQYPAVMVTTADHDDRVAPLHTFKYIAELQRTIGRSPKQTNPLLLRVQTNAGHGNGTPSPGDIDQMTDMYSFIANALGLRFRAGD